MTANNLSILKNGTHNGSSGETHEISPVARIGGIACDNIEVHVDAFCSSSRNTRTAKINKLDLQKTDHKVHVSAFGLLKQNQMELE